VPPSCPENELAATRFDIRLPHFGTRQGLPSLCNFGFSGELAALHFGAFIATIQAEASLITVTTTLVHQRIFGGVFCTAQKILFGKIRHNSAFIA